MASAKDVAGEVLGVVAGRVAGMAARHAAEQKCINASRVRCARGFTDHPPPLPTMSAWGLVMRLASSALLSSASARIFLSLANSRMVLPVLKESLAMAAAAS